ncbi:putative small ubiquitin-related modifier 6 [Brassica napus]|uniref:putative small ubiquitin-related modifier 6 n=1 Tax=Brassica napus TaxID=3708 RepID=UPI00207A0AE1|nr:putative small ubiquitin-related modifier 6 [Brassica napus]
MSTKQGRESGSTSVKKEEKKVKSESASTHVTLRFKGQIYEEEVRVFRMRRNVEMRKVMKRYGETRGVKWTTFVFILKDGTRIRESHTPDELELKDGAKIDAMLHHEGGGYGPSSITF